MKVPPKRKGNLQDFLIGLNERHRLNESPSEKEGKLCLLAVLRGISRGLNESPSEKEGKC